MTRDHAHAGDEAPALTSAQFATRLARAAAAALIFGLPMLMTMEMWWQGFLMQPARLVVFLLVLLPLLAAFCSFSGFEQARGPLDDVLDALIALGVGFVTAAVALSLFGMITAAMPVREILGKVAVQAIPASFGAALARAQLSGDDVVEREEEEGYAGELVLMAAGALFLAFNLAPTDEMPMLAYSMDSWQFLLMCVLSLGLMHAFVYSVGFRGGSAIPEGSGPLRVFTLYSVTGYAAALVISAFVLWTFGRFDGLAAGQALRVTVVLGFPASVGAAAARLIL